MEFFPLGDLQQYIGPAFPEAEARLIIAQILEALNFMHERDFTHRDIKPANILVSVRAPRWWVKLADFGLSKRAAKGVTKLQTQVFTPQFVAPEVLFLSEFYTSAVDIWSTGILAFLLLSGTLPFETFPDLARFWTIQQHFRSREMISLDISNEAHHFLQLLINCTPKSRPPARVCLHHTWIKQTEEVATQAPLQHPSEVYHDKTVSTPDAQSRTPISRQYDLNATRTYRMSYSANCTLVAVDVGNVVRLMDANTGEYNSLPISEEDDVFRLAFSPSGNILATQGKSKGIMLWNLDHGLQATTLQRTNAFGNILFSPDGRLIALWAFQKPGFRVFKTATGEELHPPPGIPEKSTTYLAFSPDSRRLAVRFLDGRVGVFNLPDLVLTVQLDSAANRSLESVLSIAYTSTGHVIVAHDNSTFDVWNSQHRLTMRLGTPTPAAARYQFAVSPDGQTLVRENPSGTVLELWSITSGRQTTSFHHGRARARDLRFTPSGKSVVHSTGFPDHRQVSVWHVDTGECAYRHVNNDNSAEFALSSDGKTLAVALDGGVLEIVDLEDLERRRVVVE